MYNKQKNRKEYPVIYREYTPHYYGYTNKLKNQSRAYADLRRQRYYQRTGKLAPNFEPTGAISSRRFR